MTNIGQQCNNITKISPCEAESNRVTGRSLCSCGHRGYEYPGDE